MDSRYYKCDTFCPDDHRGKFLRVYALCGFRPHTAHPPVYTDTQSAERCIICYAHHCTNNSIIFDWTAIAISEEILWFSRERMRNLQIYHLDYSRYLCCIMNLDVLVIRACAWLTGRIVRPLITAVKIPKPYIIISGASLIWLCKRGALVPEKSILPILWASADRNNARKIDFFFLIKGKRNSKFEWKNRRILLHR